MAGSGIARGGLRFRCRVRLPGIPANELPMKHLALATALLLSVSPVHAAGATAADPELLALATCKDSWLDWQSSPAKGEAMHRFIESGFTERGDGGYAPKQPMTLLGLPIEAVYPESIGMAVGFSVTLRAPLATLKSAAGKQVGHALTGCADGAEMSGCEEPIAEKKTLMVMADGDGKAARSLVGCGYYYEK